MNEILLPKWLSELNGILLNAGLEAYAVGGLVRNGLLGLPFLDTDLTGAMQPPELLKMLADTPNVRAVPRAVEMGTVELHYKGNMAEYTCFRRESYAQGGRHRPDHVVFTDSLEEDAKRRDFTVNALYYSLKENKVIDPTGGIPDLERGVIRTTSVNPETILKDDGLRIMRMVRFACELNMEIHPETYDAAKRMVSLLKDISKERVRDELNKILLSDARYSLPGNDNAHRRGLMMVLNLGALEYVLPTLLDGRGVEQLKTYHNYDVLTHNIETCACSPPELHMRLAALLHDIGKPEAVRRSGRMYGHEVIGAEMAVHELGNNGLKYDSATINHVKTLIRNHMYDLNGQTKENKLRIKFAELGMETARELADIRRSDVWGSGKWTGDVSTADRWDAIMDEMENEELPATPEQLAIDGRDIMKATGFPPGKRIGEIKELLFREVIVDPSKNTREKLLNLASRMRTK